MSLYTVAAKGCDDNTRVEIELTDTEAAAVRKVAEAVTAASTYSCEPRLYIHLASPNANHEKGTNHE
ncbi:hypothetical protein G4X40_19885 [Rhodococcus sp. D2-41]|uniref:Uncharacterized protein n=1 Tax=Speluncibacter jeojiensis TaxID=2710754 RepID=A0A9X4LYL7_9ACTN|nr:hypothetical protein [Rhodococcus sp. D2-41]MDG3012405.1 hypothetical protein [Rhodococcus sp. D2-41]MDG3013577.1 hypothetical protein [Corynebacteriales bacterium D3-21]